MLMPSCRKKLLQTKEPINNSFAVSFDIRKCHCILTKVGTFVLQHSGEAQLMFVVLIKNNHFVAIINGVVLCSTVSFGIKVLFWTMLFV
jgi:predicted nucleic acid-binding Zn finger protein